jgi:hypothetical protein
MKTFFLMGILSLIAFSALPQSTFDRSLNEASADMAAKLNQKSKKKIVVLYVTDINKAQTTAGKYIADLISANLVNDQGNFEVFDRDNLSGITEAKKLMAEGYIDADKAKELGKLLAVDAIIIGNYTVLSSTLKLSLKALDVNSGFVIAATMKDLPMTADAGALLGINVGSTGNSPNRGFNSPINSNESLNNPETVDLKCEKNKTGDYCFTNNTTVNLKITISGRIYMSWKFSMTLAPSQTQCFYEVPEGAGDYDIIENDYQQVYSYRMGSGISTSKPRYETHGQINVEQCKSKTFVIR